MASGQVLATVLLLHVLADVVEETETHGAVDHLSEDGGVEALVEALDAALLHDVPGDSKWRGVAT